MKLYLAIITCCMLILSACYGTSGAEDITYTTDVVTIDELKKDPDNYLQKEIILEGQISEELGEKSYLIPLPYIVYVPCGNKLCMEVKINYSQVKSKSYEFYDGSGTIVIIKKEQGLYLPVPYSPAQKGNDIQSENRIKIQGTLIKDSEGNYLINVSKVIEVSGVAYP